MCPRSVKRKEELEEETTLVSSSMGAGRSPHQMDANPGKESLFSGVRFPQVQISKENPMAIRHRIYGTRY